MFRYKSCKINRLAAFLFLDETRGELIYYYNSGVLIKKYTILFSALMLFSQCVHGNLEAYWMTRAMNLESENSSLRSENRRLKDEVKRLKREKTELKSVLGQARDMIALFLKDAESVPEGETSVWAILYRDARAKMAETLASIKHVRRF